MSNTLAAQRATAYTRLENNSEFYVPADVDEAINEALRVLQIIAPHTFSRSAIAGGSQPNRISYPVPDSVFLAQRVYVAGRRIERLSMFSLCAHYPTWMRARTAVGAGVQMWAPVGLRSIVLYPVISTAGVAIECEGIADPAVISSDAAPLPLGSEFAAMIADYVAHTLLTSEPGAPFRQVSELYVEFLRQLKELRAWHSYKNPQFFAEQRNTEVQQS